MMRKIIFRAYHEYIKKMLYPIKLHLDNWVFTAFDVEWEDNVYQVKVDEKQWSWIEIMQFTGLYDKNNQPIYEWDIVKIKSTTCLVEYKTWIFYCWFVCSTIWWIVKYKNVFDDSIEIIWNQYEHPHLLTDN